MQSVFAKCMYDKPPFLAEVLTIEIACFLEIVQQSCNQKIL